MKYTVVWLDTVRDELTNIYLAAADKKAVSAASDRIDRELRIDPDRKVAPFGGEWRVMSLRLRLVVYETAFWFCKPV